MSTATAELPNLPEMPPETDEPWREELLRQWMQARLAHEAMMLEKIQQQNKRVLQVADLALYGTVTGEQTETASPALGEDMGVNIGNKEIHYHVAQSAETNQTQPAASSGMGNLAKAAIIGAALLGTGGLGAGITALIANGGDTVINKLEPNPYDIHGGVRPYQP